MQNRDISFVQLKLANIGTALFYCGEGCQLPFNTYIITALKVDNDGYVWFFINRSIQQEEGPIRPFDAQLEFYRKGCPFSMKIDGRATVVDAREKMQDLIGKGISLNEETLNGIILIKVKIEKVAYKELKEQKSFQPLDSVANWFKNILHPAPAAWQTTAGLS